MAHITGFGLENFRVFKEDTWFDFAPITILTGTNNCGKSSVNKAMLLLKDSITNSTFYEIKFLDNNVHKLGNNVSIQNDEKNPIKFLIKIKGRIYKTREVNKEFYIEIIADKFVGFNLQSTRNLFCKSIKLLNSNKISLFEIFFDFNSNIWTEEDYTTVIDFDNSVDYTFKLNFKSILDDIKTNYKDSLDYDLNSSIFKEDFYEELLGKDFYLIKDKILEIEFKEFSEIAISTILPNEDLDFFSDLEGASFGDDELWNEQDRVDINSIFKKIITRIKEEFKTVDENVINEIDSIKFNLGTNNLRALVSIYQKYLKEYFKKLRDAFQDMYYSNASKILINRLNNSNNQDKSFFELISRYNKTINDFNFENSKMFKFIKRWNSELGLSININEIVGDSYEITLDKRNIADKGTGFSQLTNLYLLLLGNRNNTIIIEEPETNLHPAMQSKLADMFVDAAKSFNIQLVIETHSEYLIRRLQFLTAKKELNSEDTIIHYLFHPDSEHTKKSNEQLRTIRIMEDGRLDKEFGTGFIDEADNLALDLYSYNKTQLN